MRCYVEVSKNHGYDIGDVIRRKFDPEIQLLLRYYSYVFYTEYHEYEKIEEERKKNEEKTDGGIK